MKLKADVEIVTGFLGSGKTSFINFLIKETWISEEKVLIIQCEQGSSLPDEKVKANEYIKIKSYSQGEGLTEQQLKYLVGLYTPHRIIVEHNGTAEISKLMETLNSKELRALCQVTTVFHMIDAVTFEMFYDNMAPILMPPLAMSNMIVINNSEEINKDTADKIKKRIEEVNAEGFIIPVRNITTLEEEVAAANLLDKGFMKKARLFLRKI